MCDVQPIILEPCAVCDRETAGTKRQVTGQKDSPTYTHNVCGRALKKAQRIADAKDRANGTGDSKVHRKAFNTMKKKDPVRYQQMIQDAIVGENEDRTPEQDEQLQKSVEDFMGFVLNFKRCRKVEMNKKQYKKHRKDESWLGRALVFSCLYLNTNIICSIVCVYYIMFHDNV